MVGGLAAGAVMGLRTNSVGNAVKYGALFAGARSWLCVAWLLSCRL
jgi:fructose-specific phosphotransferase system IIC component